MEERVSIEGAINLIAEAAAPLSDEPVELMLAAGRVLSEAASAWVDLPNTAISAMDGFALRSQDTVGAAPDKPVPLKVVGTSSFIIPFEGSLSKDECVRIFTGSPLPAGADAVARNEDVETGDEEVGVKKVTDAGMGVRAKADEFRMGEIMAQPGIVLSPGWISLLIASGWSEVKAVRLPRIRIIAVGDELKNPGRALEPGDVFPSAAAGVFAWCRKLGAGEVRLTLVGDDLYELQEELPDYRTADLVITLGGTGWSERDVVLPCLEEIEAEIKFRGMAVKPGHYTSFAMLGSLPILCLPGGPSAAEMMFQVLGRGLVKLLMGIPNYQLPTFQAAVSEEIPAWDQGDKLVRVRVEGESGRRQATPLSGQPSHREIALADGVVRVPAGKPLTAGQEVVVHLTL